MRICCIETVFRLEVHPLPPMVHGCMFPLMCGPRLTHPTWLPCKMVDDGGEQGLATPPPPSIDMPLKILPRLTPRPWRSPRPKFRQKTKMGFAESAQQGGSEKSSFTMYLVKKKMTKNLLALSVPGFITTDQWSCKFPNPFSLYPFPLFPSPPTPQVESPTSQGWCPTPTP